MIFMQKATSAQRPLGGCGRGSAATKAVLLGGVFLILMAAVGCGGSQSRTSPARSQALVLNELRHKMARGDVSRVRVSRLVGASRTLVRSMLGNPHLCEYGGRVRRTDCQRAGDWAYQADGSRSTLRLRFDAVGRVDRAEWR